LAPIFWSRYICFFTSCHFWSSYIGTTYFCIF